MTSLLLAPHNDDETLFAAFTILRENPDVVVCYRSRKQEDQGVTWQEREQETSEALTVLGVDGHTAAWWQWPTWDSNDGSRHEMLIWLSAHIGKYDRIFAPAIEDGGHPQHNLIGALADDVFGPENVTHYLTYTGGGRWNRSRSEREVEYEPEWITRKLRALACYRSQHRLWATAHHFLADQREFYAVP